MRRATRTVVARLGQEREVLGQEDPDLAVMRAAGTAAYPDRGPGCEQRIEVSFVVATDARGEDAGLEIGRRDERALELGDRVEESALAGPRGLEPVPGGREPCQRRLLDRLDLAAKARERTLAERSQHTGIDPLEPGPAGSELAFDRRSRVGTLAQRRDNGARRKTEAAREIRGTERTVRPRVTADQRRERSLAAGEERVWQSRRHDDAERVAVFRRVLRRDVPRLARDKQRDRAAVALESGEPLVDGGCVG